MENASKALIMAAEVMIGVLVLSLMVYLFISFGSSSAQINEQMDETKLAEFNSQFDKYKDKTDNTIYDIITVANLARENNSYYELTNLSNTAKKSYGNYYIIINLKGEGDLEEPEVDLTGIIEKKLQEGTATKNYKCSVEYSNATGRVKKVSFE